MVFTQTLLSQLTKNREFDVVDQDDILPNNTTFVLANLAFHLRAGEIPAKSYDAAHLDDFVAAMLEQNDSNTKAIAAALSSPPWLTFNSERAELSRPARGSSVPHLARCCGVFSCHTSISYPSGSRTKANGWLSPKSPR